MEGQNADWWVGVNLASPPVTEWYHYDLTSGWLSGVTPTHQGPILNLLPRDIPGISWLPEGSYTFYFAVDTDMNGSLDLDQLYYDSVQVTVTQSNDSFTQTDLAGSWGGCWGREGNPVDNCGTITSDESGNPVSINCWFLSPRSAAIDPDGNVTISFFHLFGVNIFDNIYTLYGKMDDSRTAVTIHFLTNWQGTSVASGVFLKDDIVPCSFHSFLYRQL
jgi:hypothetical protein